MTEINTPINPKAAAEARVAKERGDVVSSLNSIERTIKAIMMKEQKLEKATSKDLKKKYKKQIKDSNKYLQTLVDTFVVEVKQAVTAEIHLETL